MLALCFILSPFLLVGCGNTPENQDPNGWPEQEEMAFDLPYIYIETQDGKLPTNKVDYVNCSFTITNTENENHSFTVTMKDEYGDNDSVGIRLRGNSTMGYAKKPYRIKFDKKKSFFGSEKNKSWVLLADYLDPSDMRNYTAHELARKYENLDFVVSVHHVVLYINNVFKGVYLLTDQVDEKEGRTGVETDFDAETDIDFPFLIEMSHDANSGNVEGVDYFTIEGYEPIEIKYPEKEDRDSGGIVYNYIVNYMKAVCTLLDNGNTPIEVAFRGKTETVDLNDLVDEDSLIDFLLVNEIMGNADSTWKSINMHKSKNGKLKFGPVWDFDAAAIPSWTGTPAQATNDLSIANKTFTLGGVIAKRWLAIDGNKQRFYNRFMETRDYVLEIVKQLDEYRAYISEAGKADAKLWYGNSGETRFAEQYTFLRNYLIARYTTLETLLKP